MNSKKQKPPKAKRTGTTPTSGMDSAKASNPYKKAQKGFVDASNWKLPPGMTMKRMEMAPASKKPKTKK